MEPLLQVRQLEKRFKDFVAVHDFHLTVQPGEIVAVLGPNGAGKSTMMRMLAGLMEPSRGQITYLCHTFPDHMIEAKKQLGYLADQPMILPYLTGWEHIQFISGLYSVSSKEIERRALPLVDRFCMAGAIDKRATSYSHGMQQKLALITQLVHGPRILLADEPTVGLDPAGALEMQETFGEFAAEGNAVLISTHLLDMASQLASRVVIMMKGRVIAEGNPREWEDRHGESLQRIFLRLTAGTES